MLCASSRVGVSASCERSRIRAEVAAVSSPPTWNASDQVHGGAHPISAIDPVNHSIGVREDCRGDLGYARILRRAPSAKATSSFSRSQTSSNIVVEISSLSARPRRSRICPCRSFTDWFPRDASYLRSMPTSRSSIEASKIRARRGNSSTCGLVSAVSHLDTAPWPTPICCPSSVWFSPAAFLRTLMFLASDTGRAYPLGIVL